jgi:TubC N-terminal docking domain
MNEPEQIVADCEARGVRLWLSADLRSLEYEAPPGALTPELRQRLTAHKARGGRAFV